MPLTRQQTGELYRPNGPKVVQTGIQWTPGGQQNIVQQVDLSLPIRGLRMIFKGRCVIGTSNMALTNPEGFLNLISGITIQGVNLRQRGNVTLYSIDLATQWVLQHLFAYRGQHFDINGALVPIPTMPFPATGATGYINGNTGTYDFRIVCDFPFHPFECPAALRPGFAMRNEEWKDTVSILLQFANQANAAVAGALGTGAAGTTYAFSGFAGVGANPTVDIYSLPIMMGQTLKDAVNPGVITRVANSINTVLQANGSNVILANLQKQPTSRIYLKNGTATVSPAFQTLVDTNITTLGLQVGGNRNVRNKVDIFAHKTLQPDSYDRDMIQGYSVLDFMESGSVDSSYPGDQIGDGATFQLVADVAGLANAAGLIVQEQPLHYNAGALYTF